MPIGVYKRKPLTEKHRRNLSESIKKNLPSTIFKKGDKPWNKNLTKETDKRVKRISEKAIGKKKPYMIGNQFRKGYPAPPKAFKKGNQIGEETRFKKGHISKYPIKKGEHRSPKTEFKKGQIPHNKGKQLGELYGEEKVKIIKGKIRKARSKRIFPAKDTKIEVKIQNFLKQLGIEFFTHQYMKQINHSYQCDILIPSMNLVIECDGDYWHKYPIGRDIDHIRTKELIQKGFKVLRLWEFEIKEMNVDEFKNNLKRFI